MLHIITYITIVTATHCDFSKISASLQTLSHKCLGVCAPYTFLPLFSHAPWDRFHCTNTHQAQTSHSTPCITQFPLNHVACSTMISIILHHTCLLGVIFNASHARQWLATIFEICIRMPIYIIKILLQVCLNSLTTLKVAKVSWSPFKVNWP